MNTSPALTAHTPPETMANENSGAAHAVPSEYPNSAIRL